MGEGGERKPADERARGKWIKALRKQLGITQAQLAELLDTAANEISYYESGQRDPSGPRRRLLLLMQKALQRSPAAAVYPREPLTVDERWRVIILAGTSAPLEVAA